MKKLLHIFSALTLTASLNAQIVVDATGTNNRQDSAVGIKFRLDTSLAAFSAGDYTLDTFTFRQGTTANSSTLWLDIYQAPTSAAVTGLDFSTGGTEDTTGLTYLGSSSASADWSNTSSTADVSYTFSGITLTADRDIYVAISSDNTAGNFVRPVHHTINGSWNADGDFTNMTLANYEELNDTDGNTAIEWSAQVTVVPEPSSATLLGLGGLALYFVRRRRNSRA